MRRFVFASLAFLAAGAARADDVKLQSLDGAVIFSGSYGLTSIKANEFVYEGKTRISQLIWKSSHVSTLNGTVRIDLPKAWYLDVRGTVGLGGDGHMADFDWLQPGKAWSDRSLHPDTRLDHYLVGSIEIGRMLASLDETDIGLGAGFKYTDVKWSAWGGSYIYSNSGFRDSRGNFDPDQKGISYRQSWPAPYLGVNLRRQNGKWTFAGALQAGLAIDPYDVDDHWVRSLRFYDYFKTVPTVSISASADYAVWTNASVFVSGSFDKMFRVRGDTKEIDTLDGQTGSYHDAAGGDYRSATMAFGLKGRF